MKREQTEWNLRDAFPQEPQACHEALMRAAYSVKEEKKLRRMTWRTILVTVLILLATISVALAVSQWLGWTDYLSKQYGIHITESMQKRMDATEQRSFQVGPLTLTLRQCLADGRIAISNFEASTTDGSAALYIGEMWAFDPIGSMGDAEADRLGVDPSLSWGEAAEKLGLPLYNVRALMEITSSGHAGTSMEDILWDHEGKLNYLNLTYLENTQVKDTLPVRYFLSVSSLDPATGETLDHWTVEEEAEISVLDKLEEKSYVPPESTSEHGFQIEEVKAELFETGVYFIAKLTAPDGMEKNDEAVSMTVKDENGEELPQGVLYSDLNVKQWPVIYMAQMASLEALPERIMLDGVVLE